MVDEKKVRDLILQLSQDDYESYLTIKSELNFHLKSEETDLFIMKSAIFNLKRTGLLETYYFNNVLNDFQKVDVSEDINLDMLWFKSKI